MTIVLKRNRVFILDVMAFALSMGLSYAVRFSAAEISEIPDLQLLTIVLLAIVTKTAVMSLLGMHKVYWGYISKREYERLFISALASWIIFLLAVLAFQSIALTSSLRHVPRSILALDLIFSLPLLVLVRKIAYR